MQQSRDTQLAKKILHIIVVASRPLKLAELNVALSVKPGSKSQDFFDLERSSSFKVTVREVCGLIVNIRNGHLHLIHQSAKEFLLHDYSNKLLEEDHSRWKHSLALYIGHSMLASICMSYLLSDCVAAGAQYKGESGIAPSNELERVAEESGKELLEYSAVYWSEHSGLLYNPRVKELDRSHELRVVCRLSFAPRYLVSPVLGSAPWS